MPNKFPSGPRNELGSVAGIFRFIGNCKKHVAIFSSGDYRTREKPALMYIEEALMWMTKRADERAI